jgi:tRNA pseudouridine55 synthase
MYNPEGGFYLIDKAPKWTSFDVVNKIRYIIKHKVGKKIKVGHAGTLDPLASGLLIICYGKMTKRIHEYQDMTKEYTGIIQLGSTTPSYDLETEIDHTFPTAHITLEMVQAQSKKMLGLQQQTPPMYSARRIDGVRAYHLARKGEVKELKKNEVEIFDFDVAIENKDEVSFRVKCSKGTYIRSMAYEMGKALNSGAHLKSLRRTAIGEYNVKDAINIEAFENKFKDFIDE